MGCGGTKAQTQVVVTKVPSTASHKWSSKKADALQDAVDAIFNQSGEAILGLKFSFTIADPMLTGCPLIGCSSGFGTLCGYAMEDIVGRNCRFLVDPVPAEEIDPAMRKHAKDFCQAVAAGKDYMIPEADQEPWMPRGRHGDELFCYQRNARKDGSIFNNMFYLKVFELGSDLGEEKAYIVGLQSELKDGKADLSQLAQNLKLLDENMDQVKRVLAKDFFVSCSMRRDEVGTLDDGFDSGVMP
eukprot:gb/GFBE01053898.1/.p1 GENE.gb/GFBE01053898.1/~~gb/GFBE01053898.1/.p1  ORF type:complete len:243 (+),score=57.93 gb/GFBE01053898.1/:1-729(+)